MNHSECMRTRTGNCGGCSILELVENSAQRNKLSLEMTARRIADSYCPQNLQPQLQYLKDSKSGNGQFVQQPGIIYDRRQT